MHRQRPRIRCALRDLTLTIVHGTGVPTRRTEPGRHLTSEEVRTSPSVRGADAGTTAGVPRIIVNETAAQGLGPVPAISVSTQSRGAAARKRSPGSSLCWRHSRRSAAICGFAGAARADRRLRSSRLRRRLPPRACRRCLLCGGVQRGRAGLKIRPIRGVHQVCDLRRFLVAFPETAARLRMASSN